MDHCADSCGGGFEYSEGALMHPGKKVTVLGLGKSGVESALFLKRRGYDVFASEFADHASAREQADKLRQQGIPVETGHHTLSKVLASDWILISPGIAPKTPVYQALIENQKPVFSEIEVASWFSKAWKVIAVTGSSGKTTVTTLLARSFEANGYKTVCCGNIGNPWISEIDSIDSKTVVVLELSSFQLQQCFNFRPDAGILLNISPNHLDWHKDMDEYAGAKFRMFQSQNEEDFAVLRKRDQELFFPRFTPKSRVVYFDDTEAANPNDAVVRRVAGLFGLDAGIVDKVLRDFSGLEHRLEKVAVHQGVSYVNDSKATTTAALAWALEKYPDASVHLIAGGIAKSKDYNTIRSLILAKVKKGYLIGEAAPVLKEAWKDTVPFQTVSNLKEAVELSSQAARSGETVLLSPACSSFDMFKNYQERGLKFKELVNAEVSKPVEAPRVSPCGVTGSEA